MLGTLVPAKAAAPNRYSGSPPAPTRGFCCAFARRRICKRTSSGCWIGRHCEVVMDMLISGRELSSFRVLKDSGGCVFEEMTISKEDLF
ncbi:hypothetical protein AVEN_163888-1 [Araneus ventricosus]|uniref:Uncharacterized protein n=1 Tax=Araneus ventricosus TaxID=182803 RepID=A0A4Y1ZM89_ARAVE|nr:hypothetical protein AVEN_36958-1 [Araneus ventricosus]GBL58123.1 hypothetical protein AVEN_163888-1 [Araneus ventricosus]